MNPGTVIPARPADSECELTFEFDRFPTPILASPLTPNKILISRGTVQEESDQLPNLAHTNMTGKLETPTEALLGKTFLRIFFFFIFFSQIIDFTLCFSFVFNMCVC